MHVQSALYEMINKVSQVYTVLGVMKSKLLQLIYNGSLSETHWKRRLCMAKKESQT